MNSNTVLASVSNDDDGEPAQAFAAWLDRGAPGLAAAAKSCGWDGRLSRVSPGPAPTLVALDARALVDALRAMLTTSTSFYDVEIAEPETILESFVEAELGGAGELASLRSFRVVVDTLKDRIHHFDGFGCDDCLLWCREEMRVLFVNGGD
jgi:hypothetical protein